MQDLNTNQEPLLLTRDKIRWISVTEDLPPYDLEVSAYGVERGMFSNKKKIGICKFNPSTGWNGDLNEVLFWGEKINLPIVNQSYGNQDD